MTSKTFRFILLLQRNWTESPVPTGDKMCAFVYNCMPEQAKSMFQVNFINAGNIRQVQSSFPFLSGTP
jgi:GH24 family phage-related lysozyme (muramidase)